MDPEKVKAAVKARGRAAVAREMGIDARTVQRIADGRRLSARTLEKIKPKVRSAGEFVSISTATIKAPKRRVGTWSWDLEQIRAARDAQIAGNFSMAAQMAKAMRTDAAIFVARRARLAPIDAIEAKLVAAPGARGDAVHRKAIVSVVIPRTTLKSLAGTLLDHNVAFAIVKREATPDGGRVDMRVDEWPIEHVRWDEYEGAYYTATECGPRERIIHGDGRWVVFRTEAEHAFANSTLGAACLVWAANAEGIQSWAAAARSHGKPAVIGELPEGEPMADEANALTPSATAFLQMIADVIENGHPAGLRPPGSKTDLLFNGSTAWQVFKELLDNREKAATRIYLGTDAILGSVGGAPGVDIAALFGMTTTLLQGDFRAIEEAIRSGVLEPWAAVNFGDSAHAPRLEFQIPDPDAEKKAAQVVAKRIYLLSILEKYKSQGFVVDQEVINKLAAELGVDDPPTAPPLADKALVLPELAPTTIAELFTIDEMRIALGGKPFADPAIGAKTIGQLLAESKAPAAAAPAPAPALPPVPVA